MTTFQEQITQEQTKLQTQTQDYMKEKGMNPFLPMTEGENKITILEKEIREKTFKDGKPKKILAVTMNGTEYDWPINPANPIYREIINLVGNGQREFNIMKYKEGSTTKFKLLQK